MDAQEQIFYPKKIIGLKKNGGLYNPEHVRWMIIEAQNNGSATEPVETSSIGEDSGNNSAESTTSSELEEDASSSPASSSSPGSAYELSDLMNQLPIKRGLSEYYQGKSQSFTALANAMSLEDLAKNIGPYSYNQRMKSCKSYVGFDGKKYGPKATIAKKPYRPSSFSSFKNNFVGSFRHPISLPKDY